MKSRMLPRNSFLIPLCAAVLWSAPPVRAAEDPAHQTGDTASVPSATIAAKPDAHAETANYEIGPGDILAVNVWKDAELSRTMPVRPDGKISLPVIGEILASGRTSLQLQADIRDRLRDYVRNPEVNVIVQEIKSRTFNVVGKVAKAGTFELAKPTTVLDAIALAGGFQEFAQLKKIYVLRSSPNGSQSMLPFNYKQVIKGKTPEQNSLLQPGDTVVIP